MLAAAASLLGPRRVEGARRATETLLELFLGKVKDPLDESFGFAGIAADASLVGAAPDPKAAALLAAVEARGAQVACSCATCARSAATSRPTRCLAPWR